MVAKRLEVEISHKGHCIRTCIRTEIGGVAVFEQLYIPRLRNTYDLSLIEEYPVFFCGNIF